MSTGNDQPQLLVVIGANGAGKTTWAQQRKQRKQLPKRFYNADSVAEGLGNANDRQHQARAREIVDTAIEQDLTARRSFGFESTYSGKSRPDIVRRAAAAGYAVQAVFIGTERHEINVDRVAQRVAAGGHDVATVEIVRRWRDAQTNLQATWEAFRRITILDNSGVEAVTVAVKRNGQLQMKADAPEWVHQLAQGITPSRRAHSIA